MRQRHYLLSQLLPSESIAPAQPTARLTLLAALVLVHEVDTVTGTGTGVERGSDDLRADARDDGEEGKDLGGGNHFCVFRFVVVCRWMGGVQEK